MSNKIKLTRYRNIDGKRHESGDVLTIGKDISLGQAHTFVRIGNAAWHKEKKAKKINPVLENKDA